MRYKPSWSSGTKRKKKACIRNGNSGLPLHHWAGYPICYPMLACRGGVLLPQWLCHQLMKAYYKKDRRQIKLLNECWFFYRNSAEARDSIQREV
ncbi:hypothetical protein D3C87_1908180 [compost metagenome]